MKALTVYYSQTGITAKIARLINEELGGDLEAIRETELVNGQWTLPPHGQKVSVHPQERIEEIKHDPSGYDLVIIGTPVWGFQISTPVRAYIKRYHASFKAAAFFVTCDATDADKVLRDMESFSGVGAKAQLVIRKADLQEGPFREKAKQFVHDVRKS